MKIFGFTVGPSGIGKDYGLGRVLSEYWGVRTFVSGDWCRSHQAEHAAGGTLVNDELIVKAAIQDYQSNGSPDRFLFDCPRSIPQVQRLIRFFRDQGMNKLVTWNLTASRAVCEARIKERAERQCRLDDARADSIDKRLNTYFAAQSGILHTVVPYLADESDDFVSVDASSDLEKVRVEVHSRYGPPIYGPCTKQGVPAPC